jgi:RNA polymerase sigma-70 factor (ECF subfamily)
MTTTDERAIWESARAGDPEAFAQIFDRHRARVFRQALRMTETREDAEDVTALVFLEAWRRRTAVRVADGSVAGWLVLTANNVARNAERSRRRYRSFLGRLHEPGVSPDTVPALEERLDRESLAARVRDALARLPRRDQDVIALCTVQELTAADAGAVLGVPAGTVKSRLSRARARLAADVLAALDDASSAGGAR